jgi:hypothetical protein
MSKDVVHNGPAVARNTRRALLLAGGTAAAGAVAAAAAAPAEAANGGAVLLGTANTATIATTINATATRGGVITTHNAGTAAGAFFTSTGGSGFAGGTYHPNFAGVSSANYATVGGSGAAVIAVGLRNSGVIGSTAGQRFAGRFLNLAGTATPGSSGGVYADGGLGDGVVGLTSGDPAHFAGVVGGQFQGGVGVVGFGDGGAAGVNGDGNSDGAWGVWATAEGDALVTPKFTTQPVALVAEVFQGATDAIHATGAVRITGDLFVNGTIHTNNPVDTSWTPPPVAPNTRRLQRNAGRAATKARASLQQVG